MRIESPIFGAMGATPGAAKTAHVIVLANEKGGSGKTTTAMHVIVALLKAGQKVAAIDIDSRQQSLSRYRLIIQQQQLQKLLKLYIQL